MSTSTPTNPASSADAVPAKARRSRGRRPGEPMAALLLDRRTSEWARRAELIEVLTSACGSSVTPLLSTRIERAAETMVLAEVARARYLAGEAISLDDITRIERVAALAERQLGIGAKRSVPKPSLAAYLASKSEAAA